MALQKTSRFSNIAMLLLALCPILSMYGSFLNYGVLLLLFWVGIIIMSSSKRMNYYLPPNYDVYWLFLALDYLIITHKISALIPGGLNFFTFSIIAIFLARQFNFDYLKKYVRILIIISGVLFVAQEVMWYSTGSRFVPLLNLGPLTTTMTYEGMVARNMLMRRSASIFFEPAQFATFLSMGLLLEVFSYKGKRFLSNYAWFIIILLLLLRSGTGLIGLVVVVLYKMRTYIRHFSQGRRIIVAVLMAGAIAGAVFLYLKTNAGSEMLKRSQTELTIDDEGYSYGRFVQGFIVYGELSPISKIIGTSDEELLPIARKYSYVFGYTDQRDNLLYMNGLAHILCHTGMIGLLLFLLVLYKLYQNNNEISKCALLMLFIFSFFEQTYCQPFMMTIIIMATYYYRHSILKLANG